LSGPPGRRLQGGGPKGPRAYTNRVDDADEDREVHSGEELVERWTASAGQWPAVDRFMEVQMASQAGRTGIMERAEAEGWPALEQQDGDRRLPVVGGAENWRTWLGVASREDMKAATALLEQRRAERWRAEDDERRARRGGVDENVAREAADEARRDLEDYNRKRPERIERQIGEMVTLQREILSALRGR
jgi:hypothetical protein